MPRVLVCFLLLLLPSSGAFASTIFGRVRGIVHDPQHRAIRGAIVTLRAAHSSFAQTSDTHGDGSFSLPPSRWVITPSL